MSLAQQEKKYTSSNISGSIMLLLTLFCPCKNVVHYIFVRGLVHPDTIIPPNILELSVL